MPSVCVRLSDCGRAVHTTAPPKHRDRISMHYRSTNSVTGLVPALSTGDTHTGSAYLTLSYTDVSLKANIWKKLIHLVVSHYLE